MAEDHVITNVYMTYVRNNPYLYPTLDQRTITSANKNARSCPTGWHIIPNMLWRHFCKPRQWNELMINYEEYSVVGCKFTIFNPIPITTNLAIQRTNLFAAFNNCTYINTYEDSLYETSWHPWLTGAGVQADTLNLMYKEGCFYTGANTSTDQSQPQNYQTYKYYMPEYYWDRQCSLTATSDVWSQGISGSAGVFDVYTSTPTGAQGFSQTPVPAGILWDPFERPEHIGELRAGKNSCTFSWTAHDCDQGKWYNLDRLAQYTTWSAAGPYCGLHREKTGIKYTDTDPERLVSWGKHVRTTGSTTGQGQNWEDYTIPNWAHCPIVPNAWFWQEIKTSCADYNMALAWEKIDKYWGGTESEQFRYPPHQMFMKGIPLWDAGISLIRTETQVSVKAELILKVKKRRSAYYCPTYGPLSGEQLYYHNRDNLIFQEGFVRYRTGGTRRTWQNIIGIQGINTNVHPREDCYAPPSGQGEICGSHYQHSTMPTPVVTGPTVFTDNNKDNIVVTWSKATDTSTVHLQQKPKTSAPKPKMRSISPGRMLDEDMMTDLTKM